ncbi:hypothetical protein FXO38_15969 [Capsicum annuum]|nr:hypothetical protein FXO38_15969 [Capsicum annuum]
MEQENNQVPYLVYASTIPSPLHPPQAWLEVALTGQALTFTIQVNGRDYLVMIQNPCDLAHIITEGMTLGTEVFNSTTQQNPALPFYPPASRGACSLDPATRYCVANGARDMPRSTTSFVTSPSSGGERRESIGYHHRRSSCGDGRDGIRDHLLGSGSSSLDFRLNFRELLDMQKPALVVLLETHRENHQSMPHEFHFSNVVSVPVEGLAGGIAILWHADLLNVTNVALTHQEIHCGDFNEVSKAAEKFGGLRVNFTRNLENTLISELNTLLRTEHEFWRLKSRIHWLNEGDANTKFFHISTFGRRQKTKILSLRDLVGNWISGRQDIERHVTSFYTSLYTLDLICSPRHHSRALLRVVPPEEADRLLRPLMLQEKYWDVVGISIKDFCSNVFSTSTILPKINETFIFLIPKISNPATITQYRPISLCNTLYKIISKIIVNRMKPLLHNLIGPSQSSFLTNQRASDNAILVQEILHFFNTAKGGKAHMTAKIDLEKAFDRLEWSFIHDTLLHFNFPSKFIGFIMSCITSSSVSILLNGSVTPYFYPFRAFISILEMANIAGVFRNSNGEWLLGFSSKVFSPNPLEAELQALLLGLNVAIQHRFTSLQINVNCLPIVQAVSNVSLDDSPLMSDCRCAVTTAGACTVGLPTYNFPVRR